MAEYYRFFDGPEYLAPDWAEYFSRFLSDGIYTENNQMGLRVTINGLNVTVSPGYAFIKGYMYKNDADINIQLDAADAILHRVDRIVLRADITNKKITAELKKGTMSSQPLAPTLQDDAAVKEIPLAQIRVNANSGSGILTDERIPVSSLITIPLSEIWADWSSYKDNKDVEYDTWLADVDSTFMTWFNSIQEILDESTAANLLAMINQNIDDINAMGIELETKMDNDRIILSDLDADVTQMNEGDIWIKYGDA